VANYSQESLETLHQKIIDLNIEIADHFSDLLSYLHNNLKEDGSTCNDLFITAFQYRNELWNYCIKESENGNQIPQKNMDIIHKYLQYQSQYDQLMFNNKNRDLLNLSKPLEEEEEFQISTFI
jgi:hypothetical protein